MTTVLTLYETLEGRIVKDCPDTQYRGVWRFANNSVHSIQAEKSCWLWQNYSFYSVNDNPLIPVNDRDLPKALQVWMMLLGE